MLLNAGSLVKLLLLMTVFLYSVGMVFGGSYQLVSAPTFELPLSAKSYVALSNWVSSDGKLVLFEGSFSDGYYLRDLSNQTTTKIDLPAISSAALSGNGKFIFFVTSGVLHRYDIANMTYELITSGNEDLNYSSVLGEGIVTDFDGRYVAFIGRSGDNDSLFVHDMQTGQDTLEGISEFGIVATKLDYSMRGMDMSLDGRFIAFGVADSENLGHGNALLFVRDRVEGTIDSIIEATEVTPAPGQFNMNNTNPISMSGDGRFIFGQGTTIAPYIRQVVAFDRVTREFEVISDSSDGSLGNGHSGTGRPGVVSNYDGSLVVFTSSATNLLDGVTWQGIYLKDRNTNELTLVSPSYSSYAGWPTISDDGSTAFFLTSGSLVDEDTDLSRSDTYAYLLVNDLDGDGYTGDVDCDDNEFNINPSQPEIPYNNYDENCSGMDDDDDLDGDGYGIADDCNDEDFDTNPGQPEIPYNNYDENCSGMDDDDDLDGDGYGIDEDCNDDDATVYPGAPEVKHDDVDQDCNGSDLTIDIVNAVYNVKKSFLTIKATSSLNEAANLEVLDYGPMKLKNKKDEWLYTFVGANPESVTVIGLEGSETTNVTVELR